MLWKQIIKELKKDHRVKYEYRMNDVMYVMSLIKSANEILSALLYV